LHSLQLLDIMFSYQPYKWAYLPLDVQVVRKRQGSNRT
jgi:hypothetical protein